MLPFKNCFFVFFHNCLQGLQTDSSVCAILYHIPTSKIRSIDTGTLIAYMVPQLCYACFRTCSSLCLTMSLSWDFPRVVDDSFSVQSSSNVTLSVRFSQMSPSPIGFPGHQSKLVALFYTITSFKFIF